MARWLRRLRGVIGTGLTWGVGWGLVGVLIGVGLALGLPLQWFIEVFDAPPERQDVGMLVLKSGQEAPQFFFGLEQLEGDIRARAPGDLLPEGFPLDQGALEANLRILQLGPKFVELERR